MQLKLKRSQKTSGIVSATAIFCLDARVEFTPEEQQSVTRYKLQNEVIYNSGASKRLLDKSDAQQDGSALGGVKSLALVALARMKLNISISSLQRGQHIECKNLDELLGAEEAIMTACQNLKAYLAAASCFDGREILIDFADDQPAIVAHAVTPSPQLIAPAPVASVITPDPGDSDETAPPNGQPVTNQPETLATQFGWDDPDTRLIIMILGGVLLIVLVVLLRACAS